MVTNLVKNSVQAMPEMPHAPEIKVTVETKGGDVLIVVKDNGLGIEADNESKIFEPKFTTKSSGMGLGLPMVKNIVETFGGSITFTSELGVGTEFIVAFPRV